MPTDPRTQRPALSQTNRDLLAARLRGQRNAEPVIPPRADPLFAPLSFAQEQLWKIELAAPGRPWHNIPLAYQVDGPLDAALLEQSFNEVVARHESLRTTFRSVSGVPMQVISPHVHVSLDQADLTSDADSDSSLRTVARIEALAPFDLERGPLVRFVLARCTAERHVLFVTVHHIVCDGWSINILLREMCTIYRARKAGASPTLDPLEFQFGDYASWQRRMSHGAAFDKLRGFWRERLSGLPSLVLPTDQPRDGQPMRLTACRSKWLPPRLIRTLRSRAGAEGVSLFMLVTAAVLIQVHERTGLLDLRLGGSVANRHLAGLDRLIGHFINTVILRVDFSRDPTLRELLVRVRESSTSAYEHEALPLQHVVADWQTQTGADCRSLFGVLLNAESPLTVGAGLPGATLRPWRPGSSYEHPGAGPTTYDWFIVLREQEGRVELSWSSDPKLFRLETIKGLFDRVESLLEQLADAPERKLSQLRR